MNLAILFQLHHCGRAYIFCKNNRLILIVLNKLGMRKFLLHRLKINAGKDCMALWVEYFCQNK